MAFALADITLLQAATVLGTALFASIIGGMAGYGTGLLLPLALVPVIGAENTVPVIAVTALMTNGSRLYALRNHVDLRALALMLPLALPLVALSAWLFTRLDERGASLLIGALLVLLVPLRRLLERRGFRLSGLPLALSGGIYGFISGCSTGSGVILISFLMASGLTGPAVVATDAAISIAIGLVKATTFASLGALTPALLVFALIIGLTTVPGAFIARHLMERLPVRLHTLLLDAMVVIGGLMLIVRGLRT